MGGKISCTLRIERRALSVMSEGTGSVLGRARGFVIATSVSVNKRFKGPVYNLPLYDLSGIRALNLPSYQDLLWFNIDIRRPVVGGLGGGKASADGTRSFARFIGRHFAIAGHCFRILRLNRQARCFAFFVVESGCEHGVEKFEVVGQQWLQLPDLFGLQPAGFTHLCRVA